MGSMQGGRGEEERGEVSEKGSKEELNRKQRVGGGKRDGGVGGEWEKERDGKEQRGWNSERRAESGKAGNGAEKATHTQLLNTKSFISCEVTTTVSMMPRVMYITTKCLRA